MGSDQLYQIVWTDRSLKDVEATGDLNNSFGRMGGKLDCIRLKKNRRREVESMEVQRIHLRNLGQKREEKCTVNEEEIRLREYCY